MGIRISQLPTTIASAYQDILAIVQSGVTQQLTRAQLFKPYIVSVKDFGAVGDGVTDDTAAFTLAMSSLGGSGGTVTFIGTYLINGALSIPDGVTLSGSAYSV